MPGINELCSLLGQLLPLECMQARFMQQALLGLLLLAPLTAALGVQVVHFRMAFFADAISHSAFAGVALGLLFAINPHWTLPLFSLIVGLGIISVTRNSDLSSDTIIGVFFSAVIAFGLAVISREPGAARDMQTFLYGDILTLDDSMISWLLLLFAVNVVFQIAGFNHLLYIGSNPVLAAAHQVKVAFWQYLHAALLALVVASSVQAVGVLLVTAMLIVPAAAARNFARSARSMFWWAQGISVFSAMAGLLISAQDWARTATGATIILVACSWFLAGIFWNCLRD